MELNDAWDNIKELLAKEDSINSSNQILSSTPKDSGSVEPVKTQGTQNQNAGLDFKGDWKTAGGWRAEISGKLCGFWYGWAFIGPIRVPSFWDTKGLSGNPELSLTQRRRPAEFWEP